MRIFTHTAAAFITTSAARRSAVIAFVALAMTTANNSGSARTPGMPLWASRASATSPMDKSASTPQCGGCRFELAENGPDTGSAVPDLQFETKDNGTAANIPVGRRFQILLEENPTTG